MAPSTPPPPKRDELAAFTMAWVDSFVMSAGPRNSTLLSSPRRIRIAKSGTLRSTRYFLSVSASTPGSFFPSRNSSDAPPPVEMWVILSATPAACTAATESPPPTIEIAPAFSAIARAVLKVPLLNGAHFDGLRSDIEAHHVRRNRLPAVHKVDDGADFNSVSNDVIDRQQEFQLVILGLLQKPSREIEFVFFHARLANL